MRQCIGVTKKGKRCRNKIKKGSTLCERHLLTYEALAKGENTKLTKLEKLERAAKISGGIITVATAIIKIIEFIVKHYHAWPFHFFMSDGKYYLSRTNEIDWAKGGELYFKCREIVKAKRSSDFYSQFYGLWAAWGVSPKISYEFDQWYLSLDASVRRNVEDHWSDILG